MNEFELEKITVEDAFQRLKDAGIDVTHEDVVLIMEFLHYLTYFVIKKHFKLP
ncbi:hypothetical protein HNP37_004597 [Flavobacterium nitrogenifigens]|uniref:Uncharacterized protein n=2 Tax=Flavobacterium TaxID=237 RepID=A0A7W7J1V7_9FLAO|nr:hypothetical protein [Flavobacterium nitrogenifigens]MBB6389367.1 hypothetical protein [Flavobacterium notoginsengisoli]